MEITVNGKDIDFNGTTIQDLLQLYQLEPDRIVVEKNKEIVHRETFADEALVEGDEVEMVRFVGGG